MVQLTEAPRPRRVDPLPSTSTGRVSPSAAAIARPFLLLLPILTFLVPTLFVAMTRPPTHTADARLLVGGFDVDAQSLPGFVAATQTLASTYARLVATPAIADPVAKALNVPVGKVNGHISASAVPESSLIRIEGTADSEADATRFAKAATEALVTYASGAGETSGSAQILEQYHAASAESAAAQRTVTRFNQAVVASANPSASLLQQQAQAQADADAAKLKADSLATRYSTLSGATGTGTVREVAPAAYVGDNRRSMVELAIAGSVGLGLVAGIALATFVVNQRPDERRSGGVARAAS